MAASMAFSTSEFYGTKRVHSNLAAAEMSCRRKALIPKAAWTRKSSGEPSETKSWKRRTDKFMKPFSMDVYVSSRYIHVKVVHRPTSRVIAVASSRARELREDLPSLTSFQACKVVGELVAQRCKDADVYAVVYSDDGRLCGELRQNRITTVLETVSQNGIVVM